ncbi:MAG: gamma-glutamyltransferase [Methylobacteriaceae bacterium]|nr:gamma-glutamyltransferase [Methylobacteriaceae bacterium]
MTDTPVFARAAVAAPHHLAAQAGRDILAEGGNAIEAMVAMAATIAVVYPHMNGIGGDGFWLVHAPGGRVHFIEACGFAGGGATIARYREQGFDVVPQRGPYAVVTVPGAIGGWRLALDLARSLGGRMPPRTLLANAVAHARNGYPVSGSEARLEPKEIAALKQAPGFVDAFCIDGKVPGAGALRKPEALAATLQHLADAGLEDFYRGDVGRELAADLAAIGSPVTREDLRRYEATAREPLALHMSDRILYNSPPPTQGLASLIILGLFDRLGVKRGETFEHAHAIIEAAKRAYAIRDRVCTDFAHLRHDPAAFLTAPALEREAARIDMRRAAPFPLPQVDGDTVWMGAIDGNAIAVSYIQSLYWEYGSGCVLPRTGVLMQNRGISFSLDPKAVNPLMPGRRPFHTLNPPLAVFDDGRILSYGSMGGDGQPQFQAQLYTRIGFGMGLAAALDAPRFLLGRMWGEKTPVVRLEARFDPAVAGALGNAGQTIEWHPLPYADGFGHAGALLRESGGQVAAAHDPRADGGAAGL